MLTWAMSIAVEMLHDWEEGKTLWYMCWEPSEVKQLIKDSGDKVRRTLLCERTKEEAEYCMKELTPLWRTYYIQDKMNDSDLTSYPN